MAVSNEHFLEDSVPLQRQAVVSALDELLRACETELSETIAPSDSVRESDQISLGAASHRASFLLEDIGMTGDAALLRGQTEKMELLFFKAGVILEYASLPEIERRDQIEELLGKSPSLPSGRG